MPSSFVLPPNGVDQTIMIPKEDEKEIVDDVDGVAFAAAPKICMQDNLNNIMHSIEEEHITTIKEECLLTTEDDICVNMTSMDDSGHFHQTESVDANASEADGGTSGSESSDSTSSASKDVKVKEKGEEIEDSDDDDNSIDDVEEGQIEFELGLSSDDEVEGGNKAPIKSKNEVDALPPVPQVEAVLEPHHQLLPVGIISAVVGSKVIVDGLVKHNPLNEGSILWITETKTLLGLVDEIFGPVKSPYYIVRFNTDKDVPLGIQEGTAVSFVSEFSDHILNEKALYKKGYDASGDNDEELSDEMEFSDDEKEAEYRRSQRQTKRVMGKPQNLNQEKAHFKKTQVKRSGFQKNDGRKVPTHNTTSVGNPAPCVSGQPAVPSTPADFGPAISASPFALGNGPPMIPAIPHPSQCGSFMGGQQHNLFQQQAAAAAWALGMATPQLQNVGLPMNGSPFHQPMNQQPFYNFQQPQQAFPGFPNGVMFQQNFASNQQNFASNQQNFVSNLGLPTNYGLNVSLNSPMGSMFGAPSGVPGINGNAQFQYPFAPQGQIQPQIQFSMGTSSASGRPPHASNGRFPHGKKR